MINALRAEIRRLFSRRLTLLALLGLLALVGLFQLQVNQMVTPPSPETVAAAQQEYQDYLKEWEAHHEEWEAECVAEGQSAEECETTRPEPSEYEYGMSATPFDNAATIAVEVGVYLGGMVVFIAMASFIGAEVGTGSLANWLTFVPNRRRVFVSKLLVVAGFSLLVGLAIGALTVAAAVVLTSAHGQPLTGLAEVTATALRGSLVVMIFGVLGFALALLTGSTGATIGILLGGVFVLYVRIILTFGSRWAQRLSRWSPEVNLQAVLDNGATYTIDAGSGPIGEDYRTIEKTLSLVHGLGYWAVVLAVAITLTWLVFRRRDVT